MELSKAAALVTGGSSGIGLETARQLRARGAQVAICGRDATKLNEAAESIGALAIHCDVANEDDVVKMVRQVIETFGSYDILINNAGFGFFAPLTEMDLATMQFVFATNVFGAMLVARESAKHFVTQSRGNIINIASTAGQRGFANGTAYAASKFALTGMTECWRAELRKHNIRVMQINPSEVQTEFVAASGRPLREFSERKLVSNDIAQMIVAMLEMPDRAFIPETAVWATNPE